MKCEVHTLLEIGDGECALCEHDKKQQRTKILSRLCEPLPCTLTPGELFDRYTILSIKMEKVTDKDKREQAGFQHANLTEIIYGGFAVPLGPLDDIVEELLICNMKLWDIEDEIRALDAEVFGGAGPRCKVTLPKYGDDPEIKPSVVKYLELARSVYVTNDKRSEIKGRIELACGFKPEVKQYSEHLK